MISWGAYVLLGSLTILIDRVFKYVALDTWIHESVITPFLSFQTVLNKGISWGMLQASDRGLFMLMTVLIACVTLMVCVYAFKRFNEGFSIYGEVLVISGSVSNIIDRLLYGGVVDFIMVHKGDLVWPLFNIADIAIVGGVFLIGQRLFFGHKHA